MCPEETGGTAWQRAGDNIEDIRRGCLRALQARSIGIRNRQGVQRRIHVARIDREDPHTIRPGLFAPDGREVAQGRLAGPIGAPARISIEGCIAGNVYHDRATPVARGGGEGTEQGLGQPERSE